MLWNPKMDLIALTFINGDVHLYRMSWQKVWSVASPQQHLQITSMSWRPDGKLLAVSYSNGNLRLLGVEDGKEIFTYNCQEQIRSLHWLQEDTRLSQKNELNNFYDDLSELLLPKPIKYDLIYHLFDKTTNINRDFLTKDNHLLIKDTKTLTYLICTHGTSIAIFVYGYLLLIDSNLSLNLNYKQLNSCFLSDNSKLLTLFGLSTNDNLLVYSLFDATQMLNENHLQIKLLSTKFALLYSMLNELKSVIKEMEESWEDILVELDQRFQLYVNEKTKTINNNQQKSNEFDENNINNAGTSSGPAQAVNSTAIDSSLVHDFIQLYAFGTCSDHFKTFLIHELTEKGLKKMEASVENYYSNIQRLLVGNFHQITICMFYHLNELCGMIKWFDKFRIFSLTEQRVQELINNCANLILKSQELNFVIEQNMHEIKLFFKWLHASIIHLTDDQAVTEMARLNEEMENLILDFINNTFKDDQTINLEKVGQYLKKENLRILAAEENDWQKFVKQKLGGTNGDGSFYAVKREKSLIGCFDDFKQSLTDCFSCQLINKSQPFTLVKQYNIHKFNSAKESNNMIISYKCFDDCMITGLLIEKQNNDCYVLKHSIDKDTDVKALIINFSSQTIDMSQLCLQDIYVYNRNYITLLGTDNKTNSNTYMIQLNLDMSHENSLNMSTTTTTTTTTAQLQHNQNDDDSINKSNKYTNNLLFQSENSSIKPEKVNANAIVKCLNNIRSSSLCVSSTRKVAALLSVSRKRVRIFELEVDDEDEEDEDDEVVVEEKPTGDVEIEKIEEVQELIEQENSIANASGIDVKLSSTMKLTDDSTLYKTPISQTEQNRQRVKRKNEFEDDEDERMANAINITLDTDTDDSIGHETVPSDVYDRKYFDERL